jgi:6-phosphogluconolactonase
MGDTTRFWVGASTLGTLGSVARGIRPLDVAADGAATLGPPVDVGPNPMYLAISPATHVLGIVHELAEGRVSTWTIEGDTLRAFGEPGGTGAADPCHLAFDESGAWLFAANYSGGRLSAHPVGPDAASAPALHLEFAVSGPNGSRQESSHPHQAVVDAARDRLLVPDLGADRIRVVGIDGLPDALRHDDARDIVVHRGAGPRHLVIAGDVAIVANELDRTASVIDLVTARELSWFDVDASVEPRGLGLSAIRLTRSGTLLVGDRDADALVTLRYDARAGALEHVTSMPTGGRHPRDLHLTRDERFALVADQASDSIAVIALEQGVPVEVVATLETPAPACLARVA